MKNYNPIGPKSEEFKQYQMNHFLNKLLDGYNQEDIDNYSLALGKLFKWCDLVIQVRKENVIKRTKHALMKKKEREDAISQENE